MENINRALMNNLIADLNKTTDVVRIYDKDLQVYDTQNLFQGNGLTYKFEAPPIFSQFNSDYQPKLQTCRNAGIHFENKIFVIGGTTTGEIEGITQDVFMYEDVGFENYTMEGLPFPVLDHKVVELAGNLIVFGGLKQDGSINNEIARREAGTWYTYETEGFNPVTRFAYIVDDGYLYVLGGETSEGKITTIQRTNDGVYWETVGDLPKELSEHNIVKQLGEWKIFGGKTLSGYNSNIYSSIDLINWNNLGSTGWYEGREGYGVACVNDVVYIISGIRDGNRYTTSTYKSTDLFGWENLGYISNGGKLGITIVQYGNTYVLVGGTMEYGGPMVEVFWTESIINNSLEGLVTYVINSDYRYENYKLEYFRTKVFKEGTGNVLVDVFVNGQLVIENAGSEVQLPELTVEDFNEIRIVVKVNRATLDDDIWLYNSGIYWRR